MLESVFLFCLTFEPEKEYLYKANTLVQILLNYIAFVHVLQLYLTRTSYGRRLYGIPSRIHNGRITNINSSIRSKAMALYTFVGKLLLGSKTFCCLVSGNMTFPKLMVSLIMS